MHPIETTVEQDVGHIHWLFVYQEQIAMQTGWYFSGVFQSSRIFDGSCADNCSLVLLDSIISGEDFQSSPDGKATAFFLVTEAGGDFWSSSNGKATAFFLAFFLVTKEGDMQGTPPLELEVEGAILLMPLDFVNLNTSKVPFCI